VNITTEEKKIMEHTLGINREATPHRNYFLAGPDHPDLPIIKGLREKGLMDIRSTLHWMDGNVVYCVTRKGKELLGV